MNILWFFVVSAILWYRGKVITKGIISVRTTNPFWQLLPKEEDLLVRDLQKWKIFPNRNIKNLYQKAIKREGVSL